MISVEGRKIGLFQNFFRFQLMSAEREIEDDAQIVSAIREL